MEPIAWFLKLIHRGFFSSQLKEEEKAFIKDNIRKHRIVLWINVVAAIFIYESLRRTPLESVGTVIASLIAPVMVLGTAWFSISFGGVPQRLINVAMSVSFWMFTAFVSSLSAMFIAVAFVTSPYLWPVLALIYLGALISCIQYDTADGLKVGLDEAVLKHSRAALAYYHKQGIQEEEEEE